MEWRHIPARIFASLRARQILLGIILLALLLGGVALRRYSWQQTTHLRYQQDIANGFYWGNQTLVEGRRLSPEENPDSWRAFARGYFGLYDRVQASAYEDNYYLDYPPLRLLVMSIWAKQVRAKFPGVEDGTPEYVEPLLSVNLLCELVTAAGIFLLVRLGVRRSSGATDSGLLHRLPPTERGWVCGLLAASVAWLEPSLILDAHAWPQWDVWILPFYLFAAIAALTRRWFWCGCLLAVGGMLKGPVALRRAVFCLLAALAEALGPGRTRARRFCRRVRAPCFSLAPAKRPGLGGGGRNRPYHRFSPLASQGAQYLGMDGRPGGRRGLCNRCARRRQLRLVEDRFSLWKRTLSLPLY